MANTNNFNINYLKYYKGVLLKKQYQKILCDIIKYNVVLESPRIKTYTLQNSYKIHKLLKQLLNTSKEFHISYNKKKINIYKNALELDVHSEDMISLELGQNILLSLGKLVAQFNLLDFTKKVNKNEISLNKQVQKILFKITLLHLNFRLFIYLREQCPLIESIKDDVALNAAKINEFISFGNFCSDQMSRRKDREKQNILKNLTKKQQDKYLYYLKKLKFEQKQPNPDNTKIAKLKNIIRRYENK